MEHNELCRLLQSGRYRRGTEAILQQDIADHIAGAGNMIEREVRLGPADRIDFLVDGRFGVEVKLKCNRRSIYRQLARYAKHDRIEALVLISGTAMGLPRAINGKLVYFVSLGRTAL